MLSPRGNRERDQCLLNRRRAREVGRGSSEAGGQGREGRTFFVSWQPPALLAPAPCCSAKRGHQAPNPLPSSGGTSRSTGTRGPRAAVFGPWDYAAQALSPACTCMKLQPPRESANNGEDNHQSKATASTWQYPFKGTRYK